MSVTLHTNYGDMKFELFCDSCPTACENFLALAASGRYDKTLFHRNIKGFMIQGGDPTGTGRGGTSIWGKPFADETVEELVFDDKGMLAMANKGPNTNQQQFFITYTSTPHLNMKYTLFGRLLYGFDTLDKLERVPTGAKDRPEKDIVLQSITIHANPIAERSNQ